MRAYTDVLLGQRKILDSMNAMLGRSRNTGAGLKSFSGTRNLPLTLREHRSQR
ncbi:MAG: hypothetical protein ACP5II_03965 [Infirmifilum sp.]|uniref:hypothetical protein n=1 Tax=Infirmifilum TaxID=2856573 RepID=UPI003C796026